MPRGKGLHVHIREKLGGPWSLQVIEILQRALQTQVRMLGQFFAWRGTTLPTSRLRAGGDPEAHASRPSCCPVNCLQLPLSRAAGCRNPGLSPHFPYILAVPAHSTQPSTPTPGSVLSSEGRGECLLPVRAGLLSQILHGAGFHEQTSLC